MDQYLHSVKINHVNRKSALTAASPQQIESPLTVTTSTSVVSKSAWNAANTWEERDVSNDLSSKFGRYLVEFFEAAGLPLTDVENEEAKATICIVRGKPRMGFELSFSASLKSGGSFKCQEFCDYDDAFELQVSDTTKGPVQDALSKLRQQLPSLYINDSL